MLPQGGGDRSLLQSNFSKKQLLAFMAIFALIGGYILWHTFASTPPLVSTEFEQWHWSGDVSSPQIYSDPTASGSKALALPDSNEISQFVNLPSMATSINIVAKYKNNCGLLSPTLPTIKLYIDNKAVGTKQINTTAWSNYSFSYTVAPSTGNINAHTITIDVTNGGQYSFPITNSGATGVSTDSSSVTLVKQPPSCINTTQLDVLNFFGPTSTTPPPTLGLNCTPDAAWPVSDQGAAAQLMGSINDYRTSLGLTSLANSPQLTASAEWKARQLASYDPGANFTHNDTSTPINRPWYQRIDDCGYNQGLCSSACILHLDENMSEGSQLTAQQAFSNWVNSPQNKANIESIAMAQTGIGVAVSKSGNVYIVQDFGALVPDISQTITTSGSWVAPTGVNWVQAECRGAGGGGNGSGAGGGGAYAKRVWIPVTPGKSYPVTVGTGGSDGSNGGSSSFTGDNGISCQAAGGQGASGGATGDSIGDAGAVFSGGRGGSPSSGATTATDNFNRPDSNPVDGNWETKAGVFPMQIISGQLANTNDTQATSCDTVVPNGAFWKDALPSNLDAEVTVAAAGSPHEPVIFNLTDPASGNQVTLAIYPVNQTIFLTGITNPITGYPSFPVNTGDKIGLRISGTTVQAIRNGVAVYAGTLPSIASGWQLELASQIECFNPGGGLRLDDFSVSSLVGTSTGYGGGEGACSTQAGHDGSSTAGGSGCDGGDGGFGQLAASAPGGGGAMTVASSTPPPSPSNVQSFKVLGSGPQTVPFTYTYREAACHDSLYVFKVDSADGSINGVLPGDPAWPAAVDSRNPQLVFNSDTSFPVANLDLNFQGGDILAFRFVGCLDTFYSFPAANGGATYVQVSYDNTTQAWQLGWEDLGLGGGDYNDMIIEVAGVQGLGPGDQGGGGSVTNNNSGGDGQVVITMASDPYLQQTPDGAIYYDDQSGDGLQLVPDADTVSAIGLSGGAPTPISTAPNNASTVSTSQLRTLSGVSGTTSCTSLSPGGFFPISQTIDYSLFDPVNFLGSNRIAGPKPKCIKYKLVNNFNYKTINYVQKKASTPPDCSLGKVAFASVPVGATGRSLITATGVVHCDGRNVIMGVDVCVSEFVGHGFSWVPSLTGCADSGVINNNNFPFTIIVNAATTQVFKFWRVNATGSASSYPGGETFIDLASPSVPLQADLFYSLP